MAAQRHILRGPLFQVSNNTSLSGPSHLLPPVNPEWRVDDNELAADFDGSLSGLGVDLAGIPYNMSDAILALPVFNNCQIGFQYVLAAPTSPATKNNEETLTYLNQGQSYELKIKRIGGSTQQQTSKYFKSYLKVFFHERRLQFAESEQVDIWMNQRPGERILDIDAPLSYGLLDYRIESHSLNTIDFIWDSSKDCAIFIKVNCISTEFTPKKHGGEKGVPFRIQIDTYSYTDDDQKLLNCASTQIKVFKPKGADRKQKTDRDKVDKLTQLEKEKYQPSYDCTVFTEVPLESSIASHQTHQARKSDKHIKKEVNNPEQISVTTAGAVMNGVPPYRQNQTPTPTPTDGEMTPIGSVYDPSLNPDSPTRDHSSPIGRCSVNVTRETSEHDLIQWLRANRFTQIVQSFQNYSGAELLTLSRDDLISICGMADGIRLNNLLQNKTVRPKLTIYVNISQQSELVYHAIYLHQATCQEFIEKLAALFNASSSLIVDVHLQGVNKIHIVVTDEVVANLQDNSQFSVEVLKNENAEQYRVLLRPDTA